MLRLVADENFDYDVLRGLVAQVPELDLLTVQEAELRGIEDPDLLEWAANQGRIIVTHDRTTMTKFAYDRVRAGLPMLGVLVVSKQASVGQAIEALLLAVLASENEDWQDRVEFLPY